MDEEDANLKRADDSKTPGQQTLPPNVASASSISSGKVDSKVTGAGVVNSPPPAKKTPNDYIFGKLLGEGSFSSVYLAKDVKTGKEYAIKVCDKQHILREKKAESIRREKEVLTLLSANRSPTAPFFVHLYATFQDSHRLYFVVTFAHGGELLKYLHKVGSFDLSCCRFYSAEILQALRHLHMVGICHRDLKPENILLNEHGHILVTDFGSAKLIDSPSEDRKPTSGTNSGDSAGNNSFSRNRSNSFVGTAQYVSPEVLSGRYSEVGASADLWAFGCILFQLVSGVLPFQASNEYLIFQRILKLEYEFPPNFPPVVKDLVEQLLKKEPNERLGAKDEHFYTSIQNHPFFEGVDFDGLCQQQPPIIMGSSSSTSTKSQGDAIPEDYEPGFDPRRIAERALRLEQEGFHGSDDEDSDNDTSIDGSNDLAVSQISDEMGKMNVAGDAKNSKSTSPRMNSTSSRSLQLPQDESERKQRLEEQQKQNPSWHAAVKGNLILKQGLVNKRKGLLARKRLLFLTEGPHLYYCEPKTLAVKGEIPWSKQLKPVAKDFKIFFVHTPNRIYYLEDPEGYALEWCRVINEIHQQVYGNANPVTSTSSLN